MNLNKKFLKNKFEKQHNLPTFSIDDLQREKQFDKTFGKVFDSLSEGLNNLAIILTGKKL